jgi:hypothetical protein
MVGILICISASSTTDILTIPTGHKKTTIMLINNSRSQLKVSLTNFQENGSTRLRAPVEQLITLEPGESHIWAESLPQSLTLYRQYLNMPQEFFMPGHVSVTLKPGVTAFWDDFFIQYP